MDKSTSYDAPEKIKRKTRVSLLKKRCNEKEAIHFDNPRDDTL